MALPSPYSLQAKTIFSKYPIVIKSYGQSMTPLLYDGDIVFIKRIAFSKVSVNDIVCARKREKVFTHRVIYKKGDYIVTKGDNNNLSDGKLYERNLIGVVYQVKRNGDVFNPESLYLIQSTLYFKEIVKVKKAFERAKIDFIFLKGLPLHLFFEESHPRRVYADTDVLLSKTEFLKVREIFEKEGYTCIDSDSTDIQRGLRYKITEVSFIKVVDGWPILWDVHFEIKFTMSHLKNIHQLYSLNLINNLTRTFLEEKRSIKIQNEVFPILSAENLFIYLILHLFRHNFKGFYRMELIAKIVQNHNLDYKLISEKINKYMLKNFMWPAISLLADSYKIEFPASFIKSNEPGIITIKFINKYILKTDSFYDNERIGTGIERFRNILFLSEVSFFNKVLIVFNPQVLYSGFWVILHKMILNYSVRKKI